MVRTLGTIAVTHFPKYMPVLVPGRNRSRSGRGLARGAVPGGVRSGTPASGTLPAMPWLRKKDSLVPLLRGVTYPPQALAAAARDPGRALLRRRVLPFLHAVLATDEGHHYSFVTRQDLARWDLDTALAFATAMANLPPNEGLRPGPLSGSWELHCADGNTASRLLLPGWLRAFSGVTAGQPVAVVPHPRRLVVGRMAQVDDLIALATHEYETEGTPISPAPYTVTPGGDLAPFVGRPAAVLAHKRLACDQYERQRAIMEGLFEGAAPAPAWLLPGGATWTRWAEGELPLLPLVDRVALCPASGPEVEVDLAWLLRDQQGCFEAWSKLDPPRLRTMAWPALSG